MSDNHCLTDMMMIFITLYYKENVLIVMEWVDGSNFITVER